MSEIYISSHEWLVKVRHLPGEPAWPNVELPEGRLRLGDVYSAKLREYNGEVHLPQRVSALGTWLAAGSGREIASTMVVVPVQDWMKTELERARRQVISVARELKQPV